MTKLLGPRQQEALLQVPPSQKEMWGALYEPCFHAHPHANSNSPTVICEPSDTLHWLDVSASQQCG
jgi:hypothetical protein